MKPPWTISALRDFLSHFTTFKIKSQDRKHIACTAAALQKKFKDEKNAQAEGILRGYMFYPAFVLLEIFSKQHKKKQNKKEKKGQEQINIHASLVPWNQEPKWHPEINNQSALILSWMICESKKKYRFFNQESLDVASFH